MPHLIRVLPTSWPDGRCRRTKRLLISGPRWALRVRAPIDKGRPRRICDRRSHRYWSTYSDRQSSSRGDLRPRIAAEMSGAWLNAARISSRAASQEYGRSSTRSQELSDFLSPARSTSMSSVLSTARRITNLGCLKGIERRRAGFCRCHRLRASSVV